MGTVLCTDVERKSAVIVFDLTLIVIRVLPLPKDYSLTERRQVQATNFLGNELAEV